MVVREAAGNDHNSGQDNTQVHLEKDKRKEKDVNKRSLRTHTIFLDRLHEGMVGWRGEVINHGRCVRTVLLCDAQVF